MVVFVPTILITGPVGSGKTTVAIEASAQLEAAGIAHALVDTDELDRIFPAPPDARTRLHLPSATSKRCGRTYVLPVRRG